MILYVFFNDTATTEIYTLSLHDALPISSPAARGAEIAVDVEGGADDLPGGLTRLAAEVAHQVRQHLRRHQRVAGDRKSTRLNSSHANISYAVFCLKKKTPSAA